MARETRITAGITLVCAGQVAVAAGMLKLGASYALTTTAAAVVVALIGLVYAYHIAASPFRPRYTWLSVVCGCSFTNTFLSVAGFTLVRWLAPGAPAWLAWVVAGLPWAGYGLTGLSMIAFQRYKYTAQMQVIDAENDDAQ